MGRRGPLEWVTPTEFKERTSLRMHSRSGTTIQVDGAYAAFYEVRNENGPRTEIAKNLLYIALQEYVKAHGGYWNRCDRDITSGGLMKWMYDELAPPAIRRVLRDDTSELDGRVQERLNAHDIPHSRYGVLYLLGNIKIEPDIFSLVVEGVGSVGSTVGHSLTTDFGRIGTSENATRALASVGGMPITGRTVTSAGSTATTVVRTLGGSSGSIVAKPPPAGPPESWFPCTEKTIKAATTGISDTFDHNRYLGVAAGIGAAVISPLVVTGSLLADASYAIYRAAKALWEKLSKVFSGLADAVKAKFQDRMFVGSSVGALIKAVVKFAVDAVMKSAVPFLGGAMDMGSGLVRAIEATCTRIASWMDRRQISIIPGHPEEIANSIEHCMSIAIGKGLVDLLKGAASTTVQVLGPGLGSVVAAAMAAMEWLVKVIMRIIESESLKTFLTEARSKFLVERGRATRSEGSTHLQPTIDGTGILCNRAEFTEFFRKGCTASPLVPMLVLNSGICGSLMTMVDLFDDDGDLIEKSGAKRQPFDVAGDFFRRLKIFSVEYLKSSGFVFSPFDLQDDSIRGLLNHATGKAHEVLVNGKPTLMTSHVRPQTLANMALAAARA